MYKIKFVIYTSIKESSIIDTSYSESGSAELSKQFEAINGQGREE